MSLYASIGYLLLTSAHGWTCDSPDVPSCSPFDCNMTEASTSPTPWQYQFADPSHTLAYPGILEITAEMRTALGEATSGWEAGANAGGGVPDFAISADVGGPWQAPGITFVVA
jgi:hypothetical protein